MNFFRKSFAESERTDRFLVEKVPKILNMSAFRSDIAKYGCIYFQGAVACQTPGLFGSYSSVSNSNAGPFLLIRYKNWNLDFISQEIHTDKFSLLSFL